MSLLLHIYRGDPSFGDNPTYILIYIYKFDFSKSVEVTKLLLHATLAEQRAVKDLS